MKSPRIASITALACALSLPVMADGARQAAKIIVPDGWQAAYDDYGYAPAVESNGIIYLSGVIVKLEGEGPYQERYARGFATALRALEGILVAAGASLDDVVEIMSFHIDLANQVEPAVRVRREIMRAPHPAWTAVGTTALAEPDGVTEIKMIAHRSKGR